MKKLFNISKGVLVAAGTKYRRMITLLAVMLLIPAFAVFARDWNSEGNAPYLITEEAGITYVALDEYAGYETGLQIDAPYEVNYYENNNDYPPPWN